MPPKKAPPSQSKVKPKAAPARTPAKATGGSKGTSGPAKKESVTESKEQAEDVPCLEITLKELSKVLFQDDGNKIQESGRWPLVIDTGGQVATFLRYRDANYINVLCQEDMEPEKIRKALIGAIRYGKPAVLDMMEVDMYDACVSRFDEIQKGLMESIMSKDILKNEKYLTLARESDGPEYHEARFIDHDVQDFKFIIVTQNPSPKTALMKKTFPIRVVTPA